jgi:hypothetical protein
MDTQTSTPQVGSGNMIPMFEEPRYAAILRLKPTSISDTLLPHKICNGLINTRSKF